MSPNAIEIRGLVMKYPSFQLDSVGSFDRAARRDFTA